jgi:hypothetical protein
MERMDSEKVHRFCALVLSPGLQWVPPAKLFGKLSRRARHKQLVCTQGYWNCFRLPTDLGFQECSSSGLDVE